MTTRKPMKKPYDKRAKNMTLRTLKSAIWRLLRQEKFIPALFRSTVLIHKQVSIRPCRIGSMVVKLTETFHLAGPLLFVRFIEIHSTACNFFHYWRRLRTLLYLAVSLTTKNKTSWNFSFLPLSKKIKLKPSGHVKRIKLC